MTWNYRVIREMSDTTAMYTIREVYTDPSGLSAAADAPYGESLDELRDDLTAMLRALDKPVLAWDGTALVEVAHAE
jgi:hypothetical protein